MKRQTCGRASSGGASSGGFLVPAYLGGVVSALAVVGVAALGVVLTFAIAWALSRTVLRGEVSTFSLELPRLVSWPETRYLSWGIYG